MAKYIPLERKDDECFWESLKNNWPNWFCAEHDGSIAGFEKLYIRIDDLKDYENLLKGDKWNFYKAGLITGGIVAGVVITPLAYLAAPSLAAALGSLGILGEAATGTAISTLSGAALTSASLAAIGPGGVAGGLAIITATGSALGGGIGGVISNNYFGSIKGFKIQKLKGGTGSGVVFINGFISQKSQDFSDWKSAVSEKYKGNPWYGIEWEAGTLVKLGMLASTSITNKVTNQTLIELAKRATKQASKKLAPLGWLAFIASLINNPWHITIVKAQMTGVLLADLLARTKNTDGFILMGHSLGARVIYYTLEALSTKEYPIVKDVYLLGGAVGNHRKDWSKATKAVQGAIFNCYSVNDGILKNLYKVANAFMSEPIGITKINIDSKNLVNMDVSSLVNGHMEHKKQFGKIIEKLSTT
ncbi:MAG: DUF726 domain-containing protein [Lentisphaerota bacterium]